ncbi:helix-turn-helix domain-containing protein [Viridibacillus arvi]|uniref:helix-turn-helix domain-containing protein n=1 Tax=Viridibacillus arvi TaxID=263475 RepID=UPI0034CF61B6
MFVGESLKNIRILFGYSQKSLAELVGLEERDIWQYENGYKTPNFNTVNFLKAVFHVKSNYFYSEDIVSDKKPLVDVSYISFRFYDD